jgi:hypothetical protein
MQGISRNRPLFREIRVENVCAFSGLRGNSLRREQGIFSGVQGIVSACSTGAGKFANHFRLYLR